MHDRYINMHELSRHVIHMTETLDVGARILKLMRDGHQECCIGKSPSMTGYNHQTRREFEFFEAFLQNLRLRADAFDQRLHNEITLVCAF